MTIKVLISDKIESVCPEAFQKADFEVDQKPGISPQDLLSIIGLYHALVVRSATTVSREVLTAGASGNLKIVGRAGAGVDNIDIKAAETLGVKVVNTPGLNANAVAELTIAYFITLSRQLGAAFASMKEGRWDKKNFSGSEISGKTLGLVGIGNVGRLVAAKSKALGMSVLAYDPFLSDSEIQAQGAQASALDEIWSKSDFISLHLPKTPQTANLVNKEVLGKLKKTAFLVNCARGGLVDEEALYEALKTGNLGGAAVDVFSQEPPGKSPLLELPNFAATPHIGASTLEAQLGVAQKVAELIIRHLAPGA
ncbi:MAG: hydroxyacid dehydrogenase [Deltaproteobacteria bacterium]|nr:hydroxyacid dehydrogenase [Deltaproteobacteria bacterium]